MTSSTGEPRRALIYVCTTQYGDVHRVMVELRDYAQQHGWEVVGEYADRNGLAATEAERPQFHLARAAIAADHAEVFLTKYPAMLGLCGGEAAVPDFERWLASHGAEVCTAWRPRVQAGV
ncbi:recombinase family protein [Streptomyces sp. NPDC046977]|uniref:recombinase family protein n=1 Tax=Streptomyces sp. NPDC046977 TaxID=3154703 RepID=UPI0033D6051A